MKITKDQIRNIVKEELKKAAPFGSGMEPAELDDDQEEIVGHTWLTHGKVRSESLREALEIEGNPTGKIIHHDLEKDGTINYYDLQINETTYRHIPARFVEAVSVKEHHHESRQ